MAAKPSWPEERARRDEEHMRLLMIFTLPADANCVDVGASVGDALSEMVKTCPTGRHIAYEPLPDHCLRLRHTYPGVDVRQAAVADQPGQRSFNFVPGAPALSGFLPQEHHGPPEGEQINVPVVTLDDDLPDGYVPSLIKIDVEGAEELVIRGAIAALRRHHPTVVFEHGLAARYYGSTAASIHELLCDRAGLRIFDLDGNGPYSADGLKSTTFWNFVAHR